MTAVDLPPAAGLPAELRAQLRAGRQVASLASGLLMQLDRHRLTGRLPRDVQVQAGRLRHAVKLVVQATAAVPPLPPPAAPAGADPALRAWLAAQPWAKADPGPVGWVYLLCFRDPATGEHRPYRGKGRRGQYAGHYVGWTTDLVRRVELEHRNPNWTGPGRLVQVALAAGLTFELGWVEYPATLGRERRVKNQGSAYRRCRMCRGIGGPLDPRAVVAAVAAAHNGGRR